MEFAQLTIYRWSSSSFHSTASLNYF